VTIEFVVNFVLLTFLTVVAVAVTRIRSLIASAMLFGIFSLLIASLFVALDAVDVAFTEASVGAGIATVLTLATLAIVGVREEVKHVRTAKALVICVITGAGLIYATLDMPRVGDPAAPANQHVVPRYLEQSSTEIGIPNVVTSVLASYRGYDTLGEVTVIFTAGITVLCLLGASRKLRDTSQTDE